jgi:hypothetical protein
LLFETTIKSKLRRNVLSSLCQVRPKTITLAFGGSPLSIQHQGVKAKIVAEKNILI